MFADIGIGALLGLGVGKLFNEPNLWLFVVLGVFFALLPDLDFIVELVKHGRVGGKEEKEHRNLFHFPLLFIPLIVVMFFVSIPVGTLFALCVLSHFIHDSFGIGWGIKWGYPFIKHAHKLEKVNGKYTVVSRAEEELKKVIAELGDPDWIKNLYLRPSKVAIIEFSIFVLSAIVLFVVLG
ncbi:MAG: metal-dependent hydrolase [Candidatus Paceibacterota bacterium]|jgi:hypothetical protein